MSETQTPAQQQTQASPRTFYRSDYGRAARMIQAARHIPGDPYTAKPEAQLDSVSALAFTLVQTFEADSDRFDAGEFMDATQLPAKPDYDYPLPNGDDGQTGLTGEYGPDDYPASGSMLHTLSADGDPIGEYPDESDPA